RFPASRRSRRGFTGQGTGKALLDASGNALRTPPSPAAGRLDPDDRTARDALRHLRCDLSAVDDVPSRRTVRSAVRAPRRVGPALGDERDRRVVREDLDLPDAAVSATVLPRTTRSVAQPVGARAERVRGLERFD